MKKYFLYILLAFIGINNNLALAKEKIVIAADYWCPYNCIPNSSKPGFLVEIANSAFNKEDIEVEYKLMPWSDALAEFKAGKIDGVFGASDTSLENMTLPFEPQGYSKVAAYTTIDAEWLYYGPESLEGRKIGLISSYDYPLEIQNFIFKHFLKTTHNLLFAEGSNGVEENIHQLKQGKISVYIEDQYVVNNMLEAQNKQIIKHAGLIEEEYTPVYIAFSPAKAKAKNYAKLVSREMIYLKRTGKLAELLNKYNMTNYDSIALLSR